MSQVVLSLKSRLPRQDLTHLSLVTAHPVKIQEWTSSLPKVNVGESARQVYLTLQEMNRLQVDARARLAMLESLRPTVYFLCEALSKHYIGQPVILPEKPAKVATLAQALQNHLATGYKLVCVQLAGQKMDQDTERHLALACHRALSDLSSTLLRCCQLYLSPPQFLWLEIHATYLLASQFQLAGRVINDSSHKLVADTTVESAYLRTLLLATSRPYQLRQIEIAQTYETCELWTSRVHLCKAGKDDRIYVFNPNADLPPVYFSQLQEDEKFLNLQTINMDNLVGHLQDLLLAHSGQPVARQGEQSLNQDLLRHLIHAWGDLSERGFKRMRGQGHVDLAVGMSPTHYFVAGEKDFEATLQRDTEGNQFLEKLNHVNTSADPWSGAYRDGHGQDAVLTHIEFTSTSDQASARRQDKFRCQVINTSPGGYGLMWKGEMPSNVRNGEILGIDENQNGQLCIGVIRWLRQIPGTGAELGIEIFAPYATPCGIKLLRKSGESSEYLRALLLPELSKIGRPASLLVPNLIFKHGAKVLLNTNGEETKIELGRMVMSTPSFCQFEIGSSDKTSLQASPNALSSQPEEDFDSIWSSL